ncbi:unnamed protein product, partial [Brenthis ino]
MLKRPNGMKPTHLWHLTPQKDFLSVIKDRLTARENIEERSKKDFLQMVAIVVGSAMAVFYSFGHFSPKRHVTKIIKSDICNELPPQTKCKKSDSLEPCKP